MKKLLLFIFALCTVSGAWADDPVNLVSGKSAVIDNTATGNTYTDAQRLLITNGVKSNSEDANVNLKLSKQKANNTIDWFYIDMEASKTPKYVAITWTNCRPTSYDIYLSSEVPTTSNYGTKVFTQSSAPDGGAVTTTHTLSGDISGRYISFVPAQASLNGWGCFMSEFEVYEAYDQILSGISSQDGYKIWNMQYHVPATAVDQYGRIFEGETTWTLPSYATKVSGGFDYSADVITGVYTLTMSSNDNPSQTASKKYAILRNAPTTDDVPAIDQDNAIIIYSGQTNKQAGEVAGSWKNPNSKGWNKLSIGDKNGWFVNNFGTFGLKDTGLGSDASEIQALYLDIYSLDNHSGTVEIEGSGLASNPAFNLVPGWNHIAITVNTTIATSLSPSQAVIIHLNEATNKAIDEDLVIYNVYFSKVAPVTPSKSVTFNNASWGNVHVYAWYNDGSDHAVTNAWPGDAVGNCAEGNTLTVKDGTFTWTTTGEPTMIIFNNGGDSPKTADLTFYDGATYDVGGNVKRGYYIVGTMNDWTLGDEYKMTKNDAQTGYNEYMFEQLILTSTDEFKVCYSADGVIKGDHFPTSNITDKEGPYNVYFCPEGERGGDWIDGHVYMQQTYNVVVEGNKATVTGAINTGNLDAVKAAVGMSTYVDVSGATLETYFSTGNPNALYLYATNEEAEVATKTPNPVHYDGARFYYAPKGVTLVDAPASYSFPENAFSGISPEHMVTINRSIEGNKYVTSFMGRDASPGFPMVATLASGLEAYELTAAEAGQLTFTKVTGNLETNKGYVIHNTTSDPLTLTWDSHQNNQIYLDYAGNQDPASVVAVNDVKIIGTMHTVTTDGNQWILSGGEIMKANGAKITAYRAYFTGVTLPASGKASAVFVDGETTKIGSINANGEINVENGAVYNLAGQRVAHPTKGLYIVNGKKVIIK